MPSSSSDNSSIILFPVIFFPSDGQSRGNEVTQAQPVGIDADGAGL